MKLIEIAFSWVLKFLIFESSILEFAESPALKIHQILLKIEKSKNEKKHVVKNFAHKNLQKFSENFDKFRDFLKLHFERPADL